MDSTKDKIISTGLTFFMEKGYEETALSDIAKDIGITKPALYYHFDSKDKLFEEVMIYFSTQIEMMFSGLASEAKSLEQGLSIFFSHLDNYLKQFSIMFQINVENIMLNFYFLIYDAVKRVPEFQQRIAKLYSNLSGEIEK
ncbi:MAG: TetR/AcrR family transcriptional regulator, partial [Spirochaetes bacterium]|nr:TetR/AcrR family transcriptional regulator [Spirochaetota bacterium]